MTKKTLIILLTIAFSKSVFADRYEYERQFVDFKSCAEYFQKGKTLETIPEGEYNRLSHYFVYDEELFLIQFKSYLGSFNFKCERLKHYISEYR